MFNELQLLKNSQQCDSTVSAQLRYWNVLLLLTALEINHTIEQMLSNANPSKHNTTETVKQLKLYCGQEFKNVPFNFLPYSPSSFLFTSKAREANTSQQPKTMTDLIKKIFINSVPTGMLTLHCNALRCSLPLFHCFPLCFYSSTWYAQACSYYFSSEF